MWDSRGLVFGAVVLCALVASGCGLTLDADPPDQQVGADASFDGGGTDGAPPPDADGEDAAADGSRDAGPSCFADEDCDDGNPCTDDECRSGGCVREPNTARCDDGVYCNGEDRCEAGECTVHMGDPCVSDTVCNEDKGRCVGCISSTDCPGVSRGVWDSCDYSGPCDEEATRTREVISYECVEEECRGTTTTESEACSRATAGEVCGAASDCHLDECIYASECAESGSQTQSCTVPVCMEGSCTGTDTRSMTVPCGSRTTELEQCGDADTDICDGVNVCMSGSCARIDAPCKGSFACIEGTCECLVDTDCEIACASLDCGDSGCGCVGAAGTAGTCGCLG